MIPFFQLDPATLTLWINLDLLSEQPNRAGIATVVDATRANDDAALLESVEALPNAEKPRAIAIASSLWHEKRHFLDLILTNYGAFRFRQFFEIAANLPVIYRVVTEDQKRRLGVPLDLYTDPVRCQRLGIDTNPELARIGAAVRSRKQIIAGDRSAVPSRYGRLEVGGEAQLEALAYLHQSAKAQKLFGTQLASAALDSVPDADAHHAKYRWIWDVAVASNVVFFDQAAENLLLFDDALMVCVVYAALACRVWKQPQTRSEASSSYLPGERFASLLIALREQRLGPPQILPFDESWTLINQTCTRLFGRSVIEETEADWSIAQQTYESLRGKILPALSDVVMELQAVRKRLIDQLKNDPQSVLRAADFQDRLLNRIRPRVVLCSPKGRIDLAEGFEQVFGYDHSRAQPSLSSRVSRWTWAATEALGPMPHDSGAIVLREPAWMTFASELAPITKLVTDGRRHRSMLGPEIVHAEARLRTMANAEIIVDPLFGAPHESLDFPSFLFLLGSDEATCDLSSKKVTALSGVMFSKWLLLNNPELAELVIQFWAAGYPNDSAARLTFWKDWSPWVVAREYSPTQGREAFGEALAKLASQKSKNERVPLGEVPEEVLESHAPVLANRPANGRITDRLRSAARRYSSFLHHRA
jgi:hypothetical protein